MRVVLTDPGEQDRLSGPEINDGDRRLAGLLLELHRQICGERIPDDIIVLAEAPQFEHELANVQPEFITLQRQLYLTECWVGVAAQIRRNSGRLDLGLEVYELRPDLPGSARRLAP